MCLLNSMLTRVGTLQLHSLHSLGSSLNVWMYVCMLHLFRSIVVVSSLRGLCYGDLQHCHADQRFGTVVVMCLASVTLAVHCVIVGTGIGPHLPGVVLYMCWELGHHAQQVYQAPGRAGFVARALSAPGSWLLVFFVFPFIIYMIVYVISRLRTCSPLAFLCCIPSGKHGAGGVMPARRCA
jgi:hypothetical protein